MVDNTGQHKVRVKKADGSFAFVSMDELKRMQTKGTHPAAPASVPKPRRSKRRRSSRSKKPSVARLAADAKKPVPKQAMSTVSLPVKGSTTALSTTTPVVDVFVDEAMSKSKKAKLQMTNKKSQHKISAQGGPAEGWKTENKKLQIKHEELNMKSQPVAVPGSKEAVAVAREKLAKVHGGGYDLRQSLAQKPKVQSIRMDKVAPRKRSLGPVDELGQFRLTHLRRLSPDSAVAKEAVKEKFKTIQSDSYLLYLDAKHSWYQSPLFLQYQAAVEGALSGKQTLEQYLLDHKDKESLTLKDVMAIVDIHRSFE